jgi:hypothetical protein
MYPLPPHAPSLPQGHHPFWEVVLGEGGGPTAGEAWDRPHAALRGFGATQWVWDEQWALDPAFVAPPVSRKGGGR